MKGACLAVLAIFILAMGCISPPAPHPSPPASNAQNPAPLQNACNDTDCFITAANSCEAMNVTLSDDVGTFSYSSRPATNACVFIKTVVSLDSGESQEMKNLLVGKKMTCIYQRGEFDQRWVSTLLGAFARRD